MQRRLLLGWLAALAAVIVAFAAPGVGRGQALAGRSGALASWPGAESVAQVGCPSPRPPLRVDVDRAGEGRLKVAIRAGHGELRMVRLEPTPGVVVDLPDRPAGQALATAQTIKPPAGARSYEFFARWTGQPVTISMVLADDCGEWRTFAGGGQAAFQVTVSIDDVTVAEGDAGTRPATFAVSLSSAAAQPVGVRYATKDDTATAPADYESASGTLTFAPGETRKQV